MYLCNPPHILGVLIVYAETTACPEGVLVSAEAFCHIFLRVGEHGPSSLPTGGLLCSEFFHRLMAGLYVQRLVISYYILSMG